MPSVIFTHKGSFKHMEKFLKAMKDQKEYDQLEAYAKRGVDALASATPVRTGKTASSWTYEIHRSKSEVKITWINTNTNKGFNVAVGLQYGHGTGTGGYVQGIDYINPAMRPVFDEIADGVWKVVTSS